MPAFAPSPTRGAIYSVTVCDIFQHQLRSHMKKLLRVTCKGAAIYEAMLEKGGAIDQSVSVSESPEDMRGRHFKEGESPSCIID